jgi:hypothetical protein
MRPLPSRCKGLVLLSFLVLASAILAPSPSVAVPPFQPPDLDHFRCYPVVTHQLGLFFVATLTDQFDGTSGRGQDFIAGLAFRFCNPVAKTPDNRGHGTGPSGQIKEPNHHLTLYSIVPTRSSSRLTWRVHVENQFGRQMLTVGDARGLLVPTHKIEEGLEPPVGLNHFKCYQARGPEIAVVATLEDQFETMEVATGEPAVFCNPVEKVVSGTTTPIDDADAHLVCYEIAPTAQVVFSTVRHLEIDNQFVPNPPAPLDVVDSEDLLCVPSRKLFAIGFPGAFKATP